MGRGTGLSGASVDLPIRKDTHMNTRTKFAALAVSASALFIASPAAAARGGNGEDASRPANFEPVLWADGELYGTNFNGNLPAPRKNNRQSFDDIYIIGNGVEGQRPVAEAAPGPDYNGGRWAVINVTWVNPDDAVELTSDDQIDELLESGALEASEAGVYFSCPLLPVK